MIIAGGWQNLAPTALVAAISDRRPWGTPRAPTCDGRRPPLQQTVSLHIVALDRSLFTGGLGAHVGAQGSGTVQQSAGQQAQDGDKRLVTPAGHYEEFSLGQAVQ